MEFWNLHSITPLFLYDPRIVNHPEGVDRKCNDMMCEGWKMNKPRSGGMFIDAIYQQIPKTT